MYLSKSPKPNFSITNRTTHFVPAVMRIFNRTKTVNTLVYYLSNVLIDRTNNQVKSIKYFPKVIIGVIFMLEENGLLTIIVLSGLRGAATKKKKVTVRRTMDIQ